MRLGTPPWKVGHSTQDLRCAVKNFGRQSARSSNVHSSSLIHMESKILRLCTMDINQTMPSKTLKHHFHQVCMQMSYTSKQVGEGGRMKMKNSKNAKVRSAKYGNTLKMDIEKGFHLVFEIHIH